MDVSQHFFFVIPCSLLVSETKSNYVIEMLEITWHIWLVHIFCYIVPTNVYTVNCVAWKFKSKLSATYNTLHDHVRNVMHFTAVPVWYMYMFISKLWKALVKPKASDYNAGSSRNSCGTGVCVCVHIYTLNIIMWNGCLLQQIKG
jgi:hypothetical protein